MRKLRKIGFVGKPTHIFGKSETIQNDSISIREIITNFTLQVQHDEFENPEIFYDFDFRKYSLTSGEIDPNSLFAALDRFVPGRVLDLEVASTEQKLNYYKQYIREAQAYFREKEAAKQPEPNNEASFSSAANQGDSVANKLNQIVNE